MNTSIDQIGDLLKKYSSPDMDASRLESYIPRHELQRYGLKVENDVIQNHQPQILIPDLENYVSELANRERTCRRLGYIEPNETLHQVAKAHSKDIGRRGWGIDPKTGEKNPHYNVDGEDHDKRLQRAGYKHYKPNPVTRRNEQNTAENIAIVGLCCDGSQTITYSGNGFRREIVIPIRIWTDMDKLANETVQGWMNSPGHRKNILNTFFTRQGLGVYYGNDNRAYVTQLFS